MSKAKIHYYDIGDYLSREEKLKIIADFGSTANVPWVELQPNEHGDWISQRNEGFDQFIPIEPEKKFDLNNKSFFISYSNGIATSRDAWLYNSSENLIKRNISNMVGFYNKQTEKFLIEKKQNPNIKIENFVNYDSTKISWSDIFLRDASKNVKYEYDGLNIINGLYRPFFKQKLNFDKLYIHRTYQMLKIFPRDFKENLVIIVSGLGASKPFSALISNLVPNYHTLDTDQCFSLFYYEERQNSSLSLFDEDPVGDYIKRDGVSDYILEKAKSQYSATNILKEDIFYYVYGFLHSPTYRETFANDLKKMLPRLPLVDDVRDFWAFSNAGRKLADLHLNYESVPAYEGVKVLGDEISSPLGSSGGAFRVEKMRFPKKDQKDTILYNSQITISNIPAEAYEYVVNGKSAIEWIMERYAVTIHKDSGIKNDPNDWAVEVGNSRYILDLLLSIINVSIQTVEIVKGLPKVEF